MKTTKNNCCGSYLKSKTKLEVGPKPENPKVTNGVAVIYVGAGNIKVSGKATESIYYASDHHRHFKVFAEDVDSVIRNPAIILNP